jgi:molybdate transport system ATP-binding protein
MRGSWPDQRFPGFPSRHPSALIELSRCSLVLDGHVVLDEIDFVLRPGERWALIGPNGSGKTLLLKMLRGDVWPTPTGRERRTSQLDKDGIAYVGPERQDKYVRYGWNHSVAQVVTTGLFDEDIPLTQPSRAQRQRVTRVLQRFGLLGLRRRRMLTLSYGQRRLVLVARAFAGDARVLLLDEVFNGLDVRAREKLRRALERPRGGHDWVLTSHRPKELPANVTHVARIAGGRIVAADPHAGRKWGHSSLSPRRTYRTAAVEMRNVAISKPLVRISNATLYRDYRPILRDLNWTLLPGEHWAVLGANGSGKSTLLSLIYGDLHPALGGTIERAGLSAGERIEDWKRRVAWVSPELQADHFTARSLEEVVVSGRYASVGLDAPPTAADRRIARRWLEFFGIAALRDRGPRNVSYGQMRLALLARAMANDPELLLLDEPCTGLDGDMRERVLREIERLARSGTQIVMAVHDAEDIVPSVKNVLKIKAGKAVVSRFQLQSQAEA